jgi:hypothetical protein
MICLVFTKDKLITGAHLEKNILLPVEGAAYAPVGARTKAELLLEHLPKVREAYLSLARKAGLNPGGPLPVALALESAVYASGQAETQDIAALFGSEALSGFRLIHTDYAYPAFLQGIQANGKSYQGQIAILDSLDEAQPVNLSYYNAPAPRPSVAFPELSLEAGRQAVLDALIRRVESLGLRLEESDREILREQVEQPAPGLKFRLSRSMPGVSWQAEIAFTPEEYNELLAGRCEVLREHLTRDVLEQENIRKVVLMGSYVKNPAIRGYLENKLHLGDLLVATGNPEEELLAMVEGLAQRTESRLAEERARQAEELRRQEEEERRRREEEQQRQREEAERRRREEAERLARLDAEIKAKAEQQALIEEIRAYCTDPGQAEAYRQRFVEPGRRLGLPEEVTSWHIQNSIREAELRQQMGQGMVGSPDFAFQAQPRAQQSRQAQHPSLNDLFELESVIADPEFVTKRMKLRKTGVRKIVRFIDNAALANPVLAARFQKLYRKELTYYGEMSEIQPVAEGQFYMREHFEGVTLSQFARKSGLAQKTRISELGAEELKLIYLLLKHISNMVVSHTMLHEDHIWIHSERSWIRRSKEIDVQVGGFSSEDCDAEAMRQQLHQILRRLMRPGLYEEVCNKFLI